MFGCKHYKPIMPFLSCNHSVVTSQIEAEFLRGSFNEVQQAAKIHVDLTAFHFVASNYTLDHANNDGSLLVLHACQNLFR